MEKRIVIDERFLELAAEVNLRRKSLKEMREKLKADETELVGLEGELERRAIESGMQVAPPKSRQDAAARVVDLLLRHPEREWSLDEVMGAISGLTAVAVRSALKRYTREDVFERTSRGRYRAKLADKAKARKSA